MYRKSLKERWLTSLCIGAAFGLTFFFFSVLQSYAANQSKFLFALKDFILPVIGLTLLAVILPAAIILFTGPKLGKFAAAFFLGLTTMGYAQAAFLNRTHSLAGDDPSAFALERSNRLFNAAIWAAAALLFLAAVIFVKNRETLRTAAIILSAAVIGMQAAGTVTSFLKARNSGGDKEYYLTTEGMTEVSPEKNIIVIILDRFDTMYYDQAVKEDPEIFAPLTGFTYYNDNISTYSRTYPGAASIVAGLRGFKGGADLWQAQGGAEHFLSGVYENSSFIKDLQANEYRIKLYMPGYYSYRSGRALQDSIGAYNIAKADAYHITDRGELVKNMLRLSLYKALPRRLKPYVAVSTDSFNKIVAYDGATLFEMDDVSICAQFRENRITTDGSKGNYIYLHMGGCHDPYQMNENQERDWNGTMMGQLRGDLKMIYDWFDQLKKLGVYKDATIVITGDHPWAHNDSILPAEPRLTALFVKRAGAENEPLAYSSAQVWQDNLAASLIKSAGLKQTTMQDYGRAYWEIPEDEKPERWHYFEWDHDGGTQFYGYAVVGPGNDFNNWLPQGGIIVNDLYK